MFAVSLGYEDIGNVDHVIGGAAAMFNGVTVTAIYGTASDIDFDQYGLSAVYEMDALKVSAFYKEEDLGAVNRDFFGLGASYDLGGGASVAGGVVDADGNTLADLGVNFSF